MAVNENKAMKKRNTDCCGPFASSSLREDMSSGHLIRYSSHSSRCFLASFAVKRFFLIYVEKSKDFHRKERREFREIREENPHAAAGYLACKSPEMVKTFAHQSLSPGVSRSQVSFPATT